MSAPGAGASEAEAVRADSVLSAGSVASAQPALRDGLGACHRACCHRLPGGPRAAGPPVGALRGPHSQAPGGDSPQSPGRGRRGVAGRAGAQGDGPERREGGLPGGPPCATLRSRARFSPSPVELTGPVLRGGWSPFLASLSGVGPAL